MKPNLRLRTVNLLTLCAFGVLGPVNAFAQGVPEPGLFIYGTVVETTAGTRLTSGTLTWVIKPPTPGQPITLTTPLGDIAGQFSYRLQVPFETVAVSGQSFTPMLNTLPLSSSATTYDRSEVNINGKPAVIVAPAATAFSFSADKLYRHEFGVARSRFEPAASCLTVLSREAGIVAAGEADEGGLSAVRFRAGRFYPIPRSGQ